MSDINKKLDVLRWLAVSVITCCAVFISYQYPTASTPIKMSGWLIWIVLSSIIIYFTRLGSGFQDYYLAAKTELQKVHWPLRQETIQTTVIILVVVCVVGVLLWCVDTTLLWLVGKITHLNG